MQKSKNKVFLDASVLIAAALSFSGGSSRLVREAPTRQFQLCTSEYAVDEVIRNIKAKYPDYLNNLISLFLLSGIRVLYNAPQNEITQALQFIDFKDASILATALRSNMDFLITLDKKHFFTPTLSFLPLEILTPGGFIKKYLKELNFFSP